MHKVLVRDHDGNVVEGTLERDRMFYGGWKVSYGNSISCITIADIVDDFGFDEYRKKQIKMKEKIEFEEFLKIEEKLEIKMGTIKNVLRMEDSDKMLKMSVDFNEENLRTVMTNIGNKKGLSEEGEAEAALTGKSFPFITNLKPAKIMGVLSEAMIMVPTEGDEIFIHSTPEGSQLM